MTSEKARPESISEYINAAPKEARKKLREMRACIRAAAPGAKEGLKWGMPAFSYQRILVTLAAFKHPIGFYPHTVSSDSLQEKLSEFVTADASIQFPLEKPLPLSLIRTALWQDGGLTAFGSRLGSQSRRAAKATEAFSASTAAPGV